MIKKLERFVSSLTDQEIDCQLKDIFEWARIYKELLETEQAYRRNNQPHSNTFTSRSSVGTNYGHEEVEDAYKYIEPTEEGIEKITVDSFTSNPYKKVILVNCGKNKLNVIKEIRMLTGAGLAEAKNLSERTPAVLKEGINETEAQQIKNTFTAIGAVVEIN